MIPAVIQPLVRRAILDLLNDVGGEHNDQSISIFLNQLGHRVARRDVVDELRFLAKGDGIPLIAVENLGPFLVARILQDGRDVAEGRLILPQIYKHKTGE